METKNVNHQRTEIEKDAGTMDHNDNKMTVKPDQESTDIGVDEPAKPRKIRLDLGKLVIALWCLTIVIAMTTPTSFLTWGKHEPTSDKDIILFYENENSYYLSVNLGSFEMEFLPKECCVQIHLFNGRNEKYCNRHTGDRFFGFPLGLPGKPEEPCEYLSIIKQKNTETYRVMTGFVCGIWVCNYRGMIISSNGERLDDGIAQRITNRIGDIGRLMLVLGIISYIWRLWKRRGILSLLGTLFGFGLATANLWWNMW